MINWILGQLIIKASIRNQFAGSQSRAAKDDLMSFFANSLAMGKERVSSPRSLEVNVANKYLFILSAIYHGRCAFRKFKINGDKVL